VIEDFKNNEFDPWSCEARMLSQSISQLSLSREMRRSKQSIGINSGSDIERQKRIVKQPPTQQSGPQFIPSSGAKRLSSA